MPDTNMGTALSNSAIRPSLCLPVSVPCPSPKTARFRAELRTMVMTEHVTGNHMLEVEPTITPEVAKTSLGSKNLRRQYLEHRAR